MSCTTILVGKKATYDGSTMIARNDDGFFEEKKLIVVDPAKQKRKYVSKISHLTIELPKDPLRYTSTPSVSPKRGIWAANGINEANVGMTATETTTSNPLVMGADPYVVYQERKGKKKEVPGGIGEEDIVVLVLPYIRSARQGVERLGKLLEEYGTYESNGIAFNDENEAWWMETIGGHHWIAKRVEDDEYVMMPNQFGIDSFDLDDAFGEKKKHLCSKDLKKFIKDNHLDLNKGKVFNPRYVFGSHSDADHVYNTPRSWFMGRYFNPHTYKWEGEGADFTPQSDDIPWSLKPEKKITVEDIKYVLSSYYQGTEYDPYQKADQVKKGLYRPIGIARTGVMAVLQIRGYMPEKLKGIEWICFGANPFNTVVPLYTQTDRMPKYMSDVTMDVSTDNFYWSSRLLGALADPHFGTCIQIIERYQFAVASQGHQLLNEYDSKMMKSKDYSFINEANEKICEMARKETGDALSKVLHDASAHMICNYSRADK
ncbi:MAG: C69 family dipeptidase [Oscillospiraceae bacterium]|nr:C69 family dipeptidase [Oscillospiraceae bacterium]MBQ6493275.1 C69 family dipeptidase [Erysipelotrichaceae bacterium]